MAKQVREMRKQLRECKRKLEETETELQKERKRSKQLETQVATGVKFSRNNLNNKNSETICFSSYSQQNLLDLAEQCRISRQQRIFPFVGSSECGWLFVEIMRKTNSN